MYLYSDVPAARPRCGMVSSSQQGVVTHDTAVTIVLASGCNLTVIVSAARAVTVAWDR